MDDQLGFDFMPEKLIRITPAKISTWAACPRRFRMAYLDRPTPQRGGPWAHATLGAVVHNALQAYFGLPQGNRTPEAAAALVAEKWRSAGFRDRDQENVYREKAQDWVAEYVHGLGQDFTPVAVERFVSASLGSLIIEGRVDRIDAEGSHLVIVDYKTGRFGKMAEHAENSTQLGLYALIVSRAMRKPCTTVQLHHLPTGTVHGFEHTSASLAQILAKCEEAAGRMQAAIDAHAAKDHSREWFPPHPGPQCSTCDFRRHCEIGQTQSDPLVSWALLSDG
jgi:RecB family exonuclease